MKFNKRAFLTIGTLLMVALIVACSATQEAPVAQQAEKTDWMFNDIVDAQFVKEHIQIPMPEDVMLIDARPFKPKYVKGHIPMAVSIPDSKFNKMTGQLPESKNSLLIFYCEGPT